MTPTIFQRQTTFIMGNKAQKSIILEQNQKIKNFWQKLWFFKKFWLLWLLTFLRGIATPPVPDRCSFWKKSKKVQKSSGGDDFSKKVGFWPPQPAKKSWTRSSIDMGPKNLSFSRHNQAACKELENSIGSISRTRSEFPRGLYRQQIWRSEMNERAGPLPLP